MQHPFQILKPEYTQLLAAMQVRPECKKLVDETAVKLVQFKTRYLEVTAVDGVPPVFIGPSCEREDNDDFTKNPAQGWPLHSVSKWIPHNGPFPDWKSAAVAAYHLNGLDKIGASNWTWELICFYGETFNGFGYRDYHHMHSPYLWGGTNIQTIGKYDADGKFDSTHMDQQLGIIPLGRRMVELDPSLALAAVPYVPAPPIASGIAAEPDHDASWVQQTLKTLGYDITVDGNYGRETMRAVAMLQEGWGLVTDGFVGPDTTAALKKALATFEEREKPK